MARIQAPSARFRPSWRRCPSAGAGRLPRHACTLSARGTRRLGAVHPASVPCSACLPLPPYLAIRTLFHHISNNASRLKPCCFYARFKSFEEPRSPAPHADALGVPAVVTLPQVVKRQPRPAGVFHHSFLAFAAAVFELHVNQSSTKTRSRSRRTVPLRLACAFLPALFGFGQGLASQAI